MEWYNLGEFSTTFVVFGAERVTVNCSALIAQNGMEGGGGG